MALLWPPIPSAWPAVRVCCQVIVFWLAADQFTDNEAGLYFQRIRCDFSDIVVGTANRGVLETAISELAGRFDMEWKIFYDEKPKRVAVLVSKMDHCLYDLLIRHQRGTPFYL